MNISAIIQMRNNSSRFPYKVTKKIMGKYVMELLIERIKKCTMVNNIIVCTTTMKKDDIICDICHSLNVKVYRGSEDNVLDRYYQAAYISNSDIIVRVTGDCPLIDPNIVDDMIKYYLKNNYDFIDPEYSGLGKGATAGFPDGFNPEICSFHALKIARQNASSPHELEHVTGYIIANLACGKYKFNLLNNYNNINFKTLHLSLDTKTDYDIIKYIFKKLYPINKDFTINDVLMFLNQDKIANALLHKS